METALYSVTLVVVIIIHCRNINVLVRTIVVDGSWRVKDRLVRAGRLEARLGTDLSAVLTTVRPAAR